MNTMDYYRLKGGLNYFSCRRGSFARRTAFPLLAFVYKMYTTLLMLSSFLFSLARIHDWHLITQSLKTSHTGAVHVLLLPDY